MSTKRHRRAVLARRGIDSIFQGLGTYSAVWRMSSPDDALSAPLRVSPPRCAREAWRARARRAGRARRLLRGDATRWWWVIRGARSVLFVMLRRGTTSPSRPWTTTTTTTTTAWFNRTPPPSTTAAAAAAATTCTNPSTARGGLQPRGDARLATTHGDARLATTALACHHAATRDVAVVPLEPVLADIGDMQSVADDLSTFSGHLLVCNAVLRRVTRDRDDRDNHRDERGSTASSSDLSITCAGLTHASCPVTARGAIIVTRGCCR